MNGSPLFTSAYLLEAALGSKGFRYCIIGGIALQRWGAPRATLAVDLTLLTDFGQERKTAEGLVKLFTPRMENGVGDDPVELAAMHRVVLVRDAHGTPIDIALGAMPFEERTVSRSSLFGVGDGMSIRTCSAEDLIVHKTFAGRPQDWIDVGSVLTRAKSLDWKQIEDELRPLLELKESPESWDQLTALRKEKSAL